MNLFELETSKSSDPNRLPLIPFSFIGVVGGPMLTGREFCGEAGDRGGLRIICDDFGGVGLIGGVDLTSGVSSLISTDSIFSS